jgi:FkbM family methyltransferase
MRLLQMTAQCTAGALGRESKLVRRLRPAYESFLTIASNGRGIPWTVNGMDCRIDPRQRHRFGQFYDAPVATFLRERVKPGAVCLDVGANVGVYVMQFAHWSAPHGRVIAFEPNPGARVILERHIAMNNLQRRVTVVPEAVGATSGEAEFFAADADGMSRLGAPNKLIAHRASASRVPVTTLDEYCDKQGIEPDWLLIDIEGFEIAALAGARRLIERRSANLQIVVEMHPNVWDSAGTTRVQAEQLLAELKLRPVPLLGQQDALGEYGLVHLTPR